MSNKQKARGVEDKIKNSLSSFEPVHISTNVEPVEIEMVTLFTIDDKEYKVPKEFTPGPGLRWLRDIVDYGVEIAGYNLLIDVMGKEAYNDLADCRQLTKKNLEDIGQMVQKLALGAVDSKN